MSFYAPSVLSNLLSTLLLIGGIIVSLFSSESWPVRTCALAATFILAVAVWYGYGFVLRFDGLAGSVEVRARLCGVTVWREGRSFSDIENLAMRFDGDGFPFIRVDFRDRSTYTFFSRRTRQDFAALRAITRRG